MTLEDAKPAKLSNGDQRRNRTRAGQRAARIWAARMACTESQAKALDCLSQVDHRGRSSGLIIQVESNPLAV